MKKQDGFFRIWVLAFFLFAQFSFLANSQDKLHFDHFSLREGLSSSSVNCITQDSLGFIWIGTDNGLNRFDSHNFKIFKYNSADSTSITGNEIHKLLPGKGQSLWIATDKGADIYDAQTERFRHIPFESASTDVKLINVTHIYRDHKGQLYAATNQGLFQYQIKSKVFKKMKFASKEFEFLNTSEITYIFQDSDGQIWLGTLKNGVSIFNPENKKLTSIVHPVNGINSLEDNKVFCIYEDNFHLIWIGTEVGLYMLDKNNHGISRFLPNKGITGSIPHRTVWQIIEDNSNNLWFLTNGGLSVLNRKNNTFNTYTHSDYDDQSLSNNAVKCLYEDKHKNLWIGSIEDGVNLIRSSAIEFLNLKRIPDRNGLNYSYVMAVVEDLQGKIWIGTNGGGINLYDRQTRRFKYITPQDNIRGGLQADAIKSLLLDLDGNIWIGTYLGGITLFDQKTGSYRTYMHDAAKKGSLSNNIVNHLWEDQEKNIWIATQGGLELYDAEIDGFIHFNRQSLNRSSFLSSEYCTCVRSDNEGFIWVGTFFGLNRFDPKSMKVDQYLHSADKGSISDNIIYCIYQDSKNRLWIGTGEGLNLFENNAGKFIRYTADDGLPSNVVAGIIEDSRGNLWLSTNRGISRFNPELGRFVNFDEKDGLVCSEFARGASFKNKRGEIFFGGKNGLSIFSPDQYNVKSYSVPLVITDFYLYNKRVEPGAVGSPINNSIWKTSRIELKHNQSFFSFEFSTLNYNTPNKDMYEYFLEGLDKQWNEVGNNRIATYTNLSPGIYTFRIRATHYNNSVSESAPVTLVIKPPFWRTNFSYAFYFLMLVLSIYLIYEYIRERNLNRNNLLRERLEKEKAVEINQAKLRFFINVSHEFKTPLTLILSPIEKLIRSAEYANHQRLQNSLNTIYRNAHRLLRLINQILDLRRIDTGVSKLLVTQNNLVEFTREIALSYGLYASDHKINMVFDYVPDIPPVWFDTDKMEKVIFNLLSNAFRYSSEGKSVSIYIGKERKAINKESKDVAVVRISDTGKGIPIGEIDKIFTRFYQADNTILHNPASSGLGLSIAKEFVDMHHGQVTITSEVDKGTTVSIFLQFGTAHFKSEEISLDTAPEPEKALPLEQEFISVANSEKSSPNKGKDKYKLLIAEDNSELRIFLRESLESDYEIHEAVNGKEAMKILQNMEPDLVVSDIMMPEMDGMELCRVIKENNRTCQIPVILLTVLDNIEHQIRGFETKADDYVTKPFSIALLEAKITSHIENRKMIIKKYMEEVVPNHNILLDNKTDERFIRKAIEVIEMHISNTDFSAENFCKEMGMSRSNLHIKLKNLTQLSATEFIRMIRLKKAATLLLQNNLTIAEVADQVGFNSISYFDRCFRKQFGQTPSEFIQKKNRA